MFCFQHFMCVFEMSESLTRLHLSVNCFAKSPLILQPRSCHPWSIIHFDKSRLSHAEDKRRCFLLVRAQGWDLDLGLWVELGETGAECCQSVAETGIFDCFCKVFWRSSGTERCRLGSISR